MIVEDEQQQLSFRRRTVNLFPYLNKIRELPPFLHFYNVTNILKVFQYILSKLRRTPRNFFVEQYFNIVGYLDTIYNGCIAIQ